MNRPAVRNVRALRTERELARARRVHEQGRENRRVAASRRAVVALSLLGLLLGVGVAVAVTALPWWPVLVPAALLGTSMLVGRQAAVAAVEADRQERRRISRLENELSRLTTPPATIEPHGEVPGESSGEVPGEAAGEAAGEAVRATPRAVRRDSAQAAAPAQTTARRTEDVPGEREPVEPAETVAPEASTEPEATSAPGSASVAPAVEEPTTATPPQCWAPVRVPAPTYTLVASGPRRVIDNLEETSQPSAPVPVRPVSARAYPVLEEEKEIAAPIDLDAVLERRRAAGA